MKRVAAVLSLALLAGTPNVGNAGKICDDVFDKCLNDTWATKGIERYLADLGCILLYLSCMQTTK